MVGEVSIFSSFGSIVVIKCVTKSRGPFWPRPRTNYLTLYGPFNSIVLPLSARPPSEINRQKLVQYLILTIPILNPLIGAKLKKKLEFNDH